MRSLNPFRQQSLSWKTLGTARRQSRPQVRAAQVESLEDRRVLSCDYQALANEFKTQFDTVYADLKSAVAGAESMPIIGDSLGEAGKIFDNLANELCDALSNIDDNVLEPAVQALIVGVLHGGPLDILGDHDGDGDIDNDDVDVEITHDGDECAIEIGMRLTRDFASIDLGFDAKFDLGLPALPFSISTTGGLTASVGFDWPDFRFTLDSDDGLIFDFSPTTDLTIDVTAGLQEGTELTADIGFLHAMVTDGVTLEENDQTTHLESELAVGIDVDLGFEQDGTFMVDLNFDATADVALHINAMINQDFPSISGDFLMHWSGFDEADSAPTVEIRNITVDVGGYISDILSPIVDVIQEVAEPIKPIVDIVTEPIPVLSDLAHQIGLGDVTLLSLSEVADDYLPKSGYTEILEIVQIVVQVVDVANMFDNPSGPSLLVNIGDLNISNGTNGDLRNKPDAKSISDVTVKDLTDLVGDPANLVDLQEAIENSDLPVEVKEPLTEILDRFSSGISYSFPILESPLSEISKLLLGQDSTLFEFNANAHLEANTEIKAPTGLGFDVVVQGNYTLDAGITIGYDTFGLRKFIVNGVNNNGGFDGNDLLDGLFIDADTHIFMDGEFAAGAAVEYLIFEAQVTGGVSGGFHVTMPDENSINGNDELGFTDNDPQKIRPFSELGECLFATDGVLTAGLKAKIRVGTDLIGIEEEFVIGEVDLVNFDIDCVPNPFQDPPDPNLAELDPATGVLTLNVGALGPSRAKYDQYDPQQANENYRLAVGIPFANEAVPPNGGDFIIVSAFGMSERFAGVKKIVANADNGNDTIKILASENSAEYPLTAQVELNGGEGDDLLIYEGAGAATLLGESGNDGLFGGNGTNLIFGGADQDTIWGGASSNTLNGGDGDDVLTGGSGPNFMGAITLNGIALTEDGNDQLIGGDGPNFLRGGAGNDNLRAGPMTDDLDGDEGDDLLAAGAGSAKLAGDRGDDYITWEVGDGIPISIDGGNDIETNTLGLIGTDGVESLGLSKDHLTTRLRIAGLISTVFFASHIQNVAFEGLGGADNILVSPLTNTSVREVGLNLGDVLKQQNQLGDGAEDHIVVHGHLTADVLTAEKEMAVILPGQPAVPPSTVGTGPTYGGITKISGMPSYTIRLANVQDDLLIDTRDGNDTVTVKSITGPTRIHSGKGDDTIKVQASDPGTPESLTELPDYPNELLVEAGTGSNKLTVNQSASEIPLTVEVTSAKITSDLLPGVNFIATGGNFGGGVHLLTGQFSDAVNIRSTLPAVPTTLDSGDGGDFVRVGSNAPDANSHLGFIRGPLSIETGSGENLLQLSDRGALTGNQNVIVTATQIAGFAGPSDNMVVSYNASAGQLNLSLVGSDLVGDQFRLTSPAAATLILGNGGNDQFKIVSLTQSAAIAAGVGNDTVEIGALVNKLDGVQATVLFLGQDGQDKVNVNDKSTASGQTFNIAADSVQRVGTGLIKFDGSTEVINVSAGTSSDQFQVQSLPPSPTIMNVVGSQGLDTLLAPNAANTFEITGNNSGNLNGRLNFSQVENLKGGSQGDTFRVIAGSLSGEVHGGDGSDLLDYSLFANQVTVSLQTLSATAISHINKIESLNGGTSSNTLIGPNLPNGWQLTGVNAGTLNTMALGPITFNAFGNLTGGTSVDVFQFGSAGSLTGRIQDQGGTVDQLDYSQLAGPVSVNLSTGAASRVALGVANIDQVFGSLGDDLMIGSSGNNLLQGGDGHDVLAGLSGNDTLNGGNGRDVMIGGNGFDQLTAGSDEDLVIGNRTTYDTNVSALIAIMTEWKSASLIYQQRVANLRNGVGLNNQFPLKTNTVLADSAADTLQGQDDTDWFWATLNGLSQDTITDLLAGEIVN